MNWILALTASFAHAASGSVDRVYLFDMALDRLEGCFQQNKIQLIQPPASTRKLETLEHEWVLNEQVHGVHASIRVKLRESQPPDSAEIKGVGFLSLQTNSTRQKRAISNCLQIATAKLDPALAGTQLTITARPELKVRDDDRTLSDNEGHSLPGRSEYLLLPHGDGTLEILWRTLPGSQRPVLSRDEIYTFVIHQTPAPELTFSIRAIFREKKLIYEDVEGRPH